MKTPPSSKSHTILLDRTREYPSDPAILVGKAMTPELVRELLEVGPCQPGLTRNFPFKKDSIARSFHESWYKKDLPSGLKIRTDWLVYSPESHKAFCFSCLMFSQKTDGYDPTWCEASHGFSNWKKGTQRIKEHESSDVHINAACRMAEAKARITGEACISQEQVKAHQKTAEKNKQVLKGILDIVLFLAKQGRGPSSVGSALGL